MNPIGIENKNEYMMQDEGLKYLDEREKLLNMLLERSIDLDVGAIEGRLRVSKHRNAYQYYWRNENKDHNGSYIPADQIELAKKLAQKDYNRSINKVIETELKLLMNYKEFRLNHPVESVYDNLHYGRKVLITPVLTPINKYIEEWQNVSYDSMEVKGANGEFFTDNGEQVRSKIELIIANTLKKFEVPYRYEYPMKLKKYGPVSPDFLCLNKRTRKELIWEHFGKMDDPDYAVRNIAKIEAYENNGYTLGNNFIATFETSKLALSTKTVIRKIEEYLL